MADLYNNKPDRKDDNWFLRTSMKIGILGGAFFAANKLRGPTKDLVASIFKDKAKQIQEREEWKSRPIMKEYFGPQASIYNGNTISTAYQENAFTSSRNAYTSSKMSLNKRAEIDALEERILTGMERDILNSKMPLSSDRFIDPSLTQVFDIDEMFFELRRDTLWKYLQHNNTINESDYQLISSLTNPKKDKETMRNIYNLYLDTDPDFARIYINNLSSAKNAYHGRLAKLSSETKQVLTVETVKNVFLNIQKRDAVQDAFRMRVGNTVRVKSALSDTDRREILGGQKRVTAGTFYKGYVPDKFKPTGDFEYTQQIREIDNLLENLRPKEMGFNYIDWDIVNLGYKDDPRMYFRITAQRNGQVGESVIDVPIAQYDRLPGNNPYSLQRKDFMQFRSKRNSTNIIFHDIIKILNSSAITDPSKLLTRLRTSVLRSTTDAAQLEGTLRDAGALILMKDKRFDNEMRLDHSLAAVKQFQNLAVSVKAQGAVVVTLDLETLSPKNYGPNVQAKENFTFITQAGYSVAEYTPHGAIHINDMVEYYSDHAIDHIKILGFNKDHAKWLKQYLPPKVQKDLQSDSVSDVIGAWSTYQKDIVKKQGFSFANDHDIAAKVINNIIAIAKNNPDKPIYLATKFGTEFDLKILALAAPNEFAELKDVAPHLDIHGISYMKQFVKDSTEGLSQTKLLQELMGRAGLKDLDFSNRGHIMRALQHLQKQKKGQLVLSSALQKKLTQYMSMSAHNAGTDAMLLHLLGGYGVNDYISNAKQLDSEWEEVQHLFYEYKRIKSLDEQHREAISLEKTLLNGVPLSSTMLSQGRQAKQFLSDMNTRDMLPFSDVPPGKQWNQLGRGYPVVMSNSLRNSLSGMKDLARRRAEHKAMLVPAFVTKGYLDAVEYIRGAEANQNLFSNTLVNRTFYTISAFGDQEGGFHMSHDVLKDRHNVVTHDVRLSEVTTNASDPHLANQMQQLYDKIEKKANWLREKEGMTGFPTSDQFQRAGQLVIEEENDLARLPAGTHTMLSQGDQGTYQYSAPIDGQLKTLNVFSKDGKIIDVYGKLEYLITNENIDKFSFVIRGLGGKAMGVVDHMTTQGLMYGGVKMWGPGQFLEKGYTGATKQLIFNTGFQNLLDLKLNGNVDEREEAERLLKKWAAATNSEYLPNRNQIVHLQDKNAVFNKLITDAGLEMETEKFLGNINMNLEKLGQFMADTRQTWTLEKAKQWHNFFGEDNLQKLYEKAVAKVDADIEDSKSEIGKAMAFLSPVERNTIRDQNVALLKQQYLPLLYVKNGRERVPMLLQAREKITGSNDWGIGAELVDYHSMFGYLNGMDARSTQIKLHSSLQTQMDIDNNPMLTDATKEIWRKTRGKDFAGKLRGVANSRKKFLDVIKSQAVVKGNLSPDEIKDMLSIKDGLSLESLIRHPFTDAEKQLETSQLMDIIKDEFDTHGETTKELANKIIANLSESDWAERMMDKENLTFISQLSANKIATKGQQKGAFKISANSKLGNIFTLDLNDTLARMSDKEKLPSPEKIINVFEELQRGGAGFIKNINKKTNTIQLNTLVLEAPEQMENVINLLTKNSGARGFGHTTIEGYDFLKVLRSADKLNTTIENSEAGINISRSHNELMTNWLAYFLRKTHTSDESNRVPWGFTDRTKDANALIVKLQEIMNHEKGFGQFAGFKNAEDANSWARNKINNFTLADVFIHEENWKKNAVVNIFENETTTYENQYKRMVAKFGKEKAAEIWRNNTFTGLGIRYPGKQAGIHAAIESRFNIIPAEIAEKVGADANSSYISAEHWKRINGDNDGDAIFKVMHAFDTAEKLADLNRAHDKAAIHALNSIVEGGQNLRTLREVTNEKKLFISRNAEGMVLGGWKDGKYVSETVSMSSKEAASAMENAFQSLGSTFSQIGLHDPSVITPYITKRFIDQVGLVSVAKNAIGIFTNIVDTRSRQLLKMGIKDNVITPRIIGGTQTGLSALSQMPISLVKHPEDLADISMAANALLNPFKSTKEEEEVLKKIMTPLFHKDDLEMVHHLLTQGTRDYYSQFGDKDSLLRYSEHVGSRMELDKPFSMLDLIATQLERNMIHVPNMEGESLSKQLSLNPHVMANFKKAGKFGAIGAGIYLAANFFRPNQLSNSLNPLDGFVDIDADIDGNHNGILSNLELDRSVPLDMVNASFSKESFIRLNKMKMEGHKSKIINDVLNNGYKSSNPLLYEWKSSPNLNYTNYTTNIGYFGSSQLDRRSRY